MDWHKIFNSKKEAENLIKINQTFSLRIGLKKICIAHTSDGLFALEDVCPHKLVQLSKGTLKNGQITCFWHQYSFDVCTGAEVTGKNIRDVKIFTLEERIDGLYIGLPKSVVMEDEFIL